MKNKIVISIAISFFLIICGYFFNNAPLFTGESLESYAKSEWFHYFFKQEEKHESDVIYINTSYDKELIPFGEKYVSGEGLNLRGNTEITNRETLCNLLSCLKRVDYKYLIIDIKFVEGLENDKRILDSSGDSIYIDQKLVELIRSMNNVIVATYQGAKLFDKSLNQKAALAEYWATATATNFVRYEYFDSIPSIPLYVYNDLQKQKGNDTIVCHYPFGLKCLKRLSYYTQGNSLCYNSIFLDFQISEKNRTPFGEISGSCDISRCDVYNMGKEIVYQDDPDINSVELLQSICKDRYVIIGNIKEDVHDTYAGPKPGPEILYHAIKALEEGKHRVSLIEMLILFCIYIIICYSIITRKSYIHYIPKLKEKKNKLLNFVLNLFSYAIILETFEFILYSIDRTSFSFAIPMLVFTLLKLYKDYKTFEV